MVDKDNMQHAVSVKDSESKLSTGEQKSKPSEACLNVSESFCETNRRNANKHAFPTKVCPRCKEVLFEDMKICYGCLYDFERQSTHPAYLLPQPEEESDELKSIDPEQTQDISLADATLMLTPREYDLSIKSAELDIRLPLCDSGLTVGRDQSCKLVLHSRAVSRRHLRLVPSPLGVVCEDLGSTNPARFNGKEIREKTILSVGDSIQICGISLTICVPALY